MLVSMLLSTLLPFLAILPHASAVTLTQSGGSAVCSKAPYSLILPLSAYKPAIAFCSSAYPASKCRDSTSTSTATTTKVITSNTVVATVFSTTSVATEATTVETDVLTSTTSTFTTSSTTGTTVVTATFPPTTEFTTTTSFTTETVTVTTAGTVNKRRDQAANHRAIRNAPKAYPNNAGELPSLLDKLKKQRSGFLSTACSCIESHPTCTTRSVTAHATVTSTAVNNITSTISLGATTTTAVTATSTVFTDTTVTNLIEETDTASFTPTITSTITDIETTTTTSTVTVTPTGNVCVAGDGCYSGYKYHVFCGQRTTPGSGGIQVQQVSSTPDLETCLKNCAADPLCQAFDYELDSQTCTFYDNASDVYSITAQDDAGYDAGYVFAYC